MIQITHLLDDFAMGGVTRALTLFEEPALQRLACSVVVPTDPAAWLAPSISADLIVDHMALSWKRLVFLGSLRARNPGSRIVHVEHSYTHCFEQLHVKAKTRFRTMLKIAATLVDEFVCVSDAQRDWLADEVGINANKLCVIKPWTDRRELFSVPAAKPAKDRPVRLLAYGRYAPVKNFLELVRAMQAVPQAKAELMVFGDGPDRALLEALAVCLPNVEVLGPSNSPKNYLAYCDAVIVPSRSEAFGLVATEARMSGRAILVADVDGLPEQVGTAGMVAQMDTADAIADAIHQFVQCDLAALGQQGRIEVHAQMDGIIAGWSELIDRACKNAGLELATS